MKKDSKQRLFEVMGRLDPLFKPTLNEIWGWSEDERNQKKRLEQAKQEVMKCRIGATVFGELPYDAPIKNIEKLMETRLNLIKIDLPTVSELLPHLFEPQGYVRAIYETMSTNKYNGFVLKNWEWVINNDGIVRMYSGREKLLKMLDNLIK